MVYDWDGKEATCRRMYVNERKSLGEVMDFFKDRGFAPSKRAFQTQFKRWDFPTKQSPAYKDDVLVARIKELWETNVEQRQMLEILQSEGFTIRERELNRVRAKNRWLLREPNGANTVKTRSRTDPTYDHSGDGSRSLQSLEHAILHDADQGGAGIPDAEVDAEVPADLKRKREERLEKLKVESDERWATRKRRRRTRGWAGLPADPPQPPRFPSELTLDECKHYLGLDNALYREMRDQFEAICASQGIVKKTLAGPEKWQAAKDRLIRENAPLQRAFHPAPDAATTDPPPPPAEQLATALDLVCMDVTKRVRTAAARMTLAEAKNALGLNPAQTRRARDAFYALLEAHHVTSKLQAGDDAWDRVKQRWIADSPLLRDVVRSPPAPPPGHEDDPAGRAAHARRVRALEVLCRDVMKRLRDDRWKRNPDRAKLASQGPGPGPAPPRMPQPTSRKTVAADPSSPPNHAPAALLSPSSSHHATATAADLQIDPSLLLAASDPTITATSATMADNAGQMHASLPPNPFAAPISAFFRLSRASAVRDSPELWLGALNSGGGAPSMAELRREAARAHTGCEAVRIEGVAVRGGGGGAGDEVSYHLERDDELGAYLAHVVAEMGGKAAFNVVLARTFE